MTTALKVIIAIAALLLGVWLGLPGRQPSADDIEEKMAAGPGRRRKVKKRFVAVAWLQRQVSAHSMRRSRGFGVRSPEDR